MIVKVDVSLEQIRVLLGVIVIEGVLASADIVIVVTADTHPLTVLVTCTVNTPLPVATGLLVLVLFKLPVLGDVHV